MVFNAPNLILFFLTSKCLRSFFLEESISLYNEKSKCEKCFHTAKVRKHFMVRKDKLFILVSAQT